MRRSGFSLVELSIVLVILGLLVGGILAGQSLIRAAELRAVSSEYNRYTAATITFRDKYFALPGDMNNATKYWGTAANCPGTASQGSTSATTCDGNNDGIISSAGTSHEWTRFWQHMANAGLVEGQYSGVSGNNTYSWGVQPSNSPASKLTAGQWTTYTANNIASAFTGNFFYLNLKNFFLIGAADATYWPSGGVLKPEEAWNIDTKLDDGLPARGKVIAGYASNLGTVCTNAGSGNDFAATYTLSGTTKSCFLMFIDAY